MSNNSPMKLRYGQEGELATVGMLYAYLAFMLRTNRMPHHHPLERDHMMGRLSVYNEAVDYLVANYPDEFYLAKDES